MELHVDVMLEAGAKMPTKAHPETDAGFDLYTPHEAYVPAGGSATIHTGVHMIIPRGWCGLVVSKSGLNTKYDIKTTGLVDAEYTGEILIKVQNHGDKDYHFHRGEKVTQILILPVTNTILHEITELPDTERGANGFGSSGKF